MQCRRDAFVQGEDQEVPVPTWEAWGSPLRKRPAPPSSDVALPVHQYLDNIQVSHESSIDGREKGPTFLEKDSLQQRVLIPQHQTFICGTAMTLLQALQRIFIALDGGLELTDILGPSLAEGSLRLSVALLTLFRGGIYLSKVSRVNNKKGQ
jgi:hypothetical protein